jgi:hypothetical protein
MNFRVKRDRPAASESSLNNSFQTVSHPSSLQLLKNLKTFDALSFYSANVMLSSLRIQPPEPPSIKFQGSLFTIVSH